MALDYETEFGVLVVVRWYINWHFHHFKAHWLMSENPGLVWQASKARFKRHTGIIQITASCFQVMAAILSEN